jgi:hypothetical protein
MQQAFEHGHSGTALTALLKQYVLDDLDERNDCYSNLVVCVSCPGEDLASLLPGDPIPC